MCFYLTLLYLAIYAHVHSALASQNFFSSKGSITLKNVTKYISHMAPCIEVIGYRQKKKGITSFGDLCSDFGANVKFLIGQKKYRKINIGNLKINISNKKSSRVLMVILIQFI